MKEKLKTFSIKMKEDIYRDVKTQKACEQVWEANIRPIIEQPLPYNPT